MQFLILAYDAKDDGALDRRMKEREAHLATIAKYKESGNMHIGAALVHDGKMAGSVIIAEFENREALDGWLLNDPYVVGKVWGDITVTECKVAPSFVKQI